MSEIFHIWSYIKDFAIFNVKHKITLPSELVHYIYSYVINDDLKININRRYISYLMNLNNILKKPQLENRNDEVIIIIDQLPYSSLLDVNRLWFEIESLVGCRMYTYKTFNYNGKMWADSYTDLTQYGMKNEHITDRVDSLTVKMYSTKKKRTNAKDNFDWLIGTYI